MQVKLYTIRDLVAGECGPIFVSKNDGLAVRQSCQLLAGVNDVAEYSLYCVGTFDTENMEMVEKVPHEIEFHLPYKAYMERLETMQAKQTFIKEAQL